MQQQMGICLLREQSEICCLHEEDLELTAASAQLRTLPQESCSPGAPCVLTWVRRGYVALAGCASPCYYSSRSPVT